MFSSPKENLVEIPCGPIRLEGALSGPESGTSRGGCVICHPHPGFGGTMDNNVVFAVRDAFRRQGWTTLRFNFRGTGGSGGRQTDGAEEPRDVTAAFEAMRSVIPAGLPLAMVGYSFGAYVGFRALSTGPAVALAVGVSPPVGTYDFDFLAGMEGGRTAFIAGDRDSFCDPDTLRLAADRVTPPAEVVIEPGVDHFWFGAEERLARFLQGVVS